MFLYLNRMKIRKNCSVLWSLNKVSHLPQPKNFNLIVTLNKNIHLNTLSLKNNDSNKNSNNEKTNKKLAELKNPKNKNVQKEKKEVKEEEAIKQEAKPEIKLNSDAKNSLKSKLLKFKFIDLNAMKNEPVQTPPQPKPQPTPTITQPQIKTEEPVKTESLNEKKLADDLKEVKEKSADVKFRKFEYKKPGRFGSLEERSVNLSEEKTTHKLARLIDIKNADKIAETLVKPLEDIQRKKETDSQKAKSLPTAAVPSKKEKELKDLSTSLKLNILNAIKEDDAKNVISEFSKKLKSYNWENIKQMPLVREEGELEKSKKREERVEVRQRSFGFTSNDPYEQSYQLNSGKGLLMFKKEGQSVEITQESPIWKNHYVEELKSIQEMPPLNGFEELIILTDQGKLWQFPIDNEQGIDEADAEIPFYEHIFLEQHLNEFPNIEAVREFMTLVLNGLSLNSFLSVDEKTQIIEWYKEYFKEKEGLIREALETERQENMYREMLEAEKQTQKQN